MTLLPFVNSEKNNHLQTGEATPGPGFQGCPDPTWEGTFHTQEEAWQGYRPPPYPVE